MKDNKLLRWCQRTIGFLPLTKAQRSKFTFVITFNIRMNSPIIVLTKLGVPSPYVGYFMV